MPDMLQRGLILRMFVQRSIRQRFVTPIRSNVIFLYHFAVSFFDLPNEITKPFVAANVGRAMMFGSGAHVVKRAIPNRLRCGFRVVALRCSDRASARHYAAPCFSGTTSAVWIMPAAAAILFSISFNARRSALSPMWA